jgi:hypothetical protein
MTVCTLKLKYFTLKSAAEKIFKPKKDSSGVQILVSEFFYLPSISNYLLCDVKKDETQVISKKIICQSI